MFSGSPGGFVSGRRVGVGPNVVNEKEVKSSFERVLLIETE